MAVIALDLGGTKLASALFTPDENDEPIATEVTPIGGRTGAGVGELIVDHVRRLRRAAARRRLRVGAVGVAVPGIADPRTGLVWAPNVPGWERYPLREQIAAAIDDSAVKVVVDDDRAASIVGEAWRGAAKGCRDAVFLAVGTGIGAGILAGGRVLRGAHGIAGAIGWLALDRRFRDEYAGCGCFESHASGGGLARRMNGSPAGPDVFTAARRGDRAARRLVADAVQFWGMASANLVSLFNPEKLIFGGGVFGGPAAKLIPDIRAEAERWAQPLAMGRVTFEPSRLGAKTALFGAARLAIRRLKARR